MSMMTPEERHRLYRDDLIFHSLARTVENLLVNGYPASRIHEAIEMGAQLKAIYPERVVVNKDLLKGPTEVVAMMRMNLEHLDHAQKFSGLPGRKDN